MSNEGVMSSHQGTSFTTEGVNRTRRNLLILGTSAVTVVGAGFTAVPFVSSMLPSAKARSAGAPVEADISKLESGQMMTYEWRRKPVWIVRRTEQNLQDLPTLDGQLADPDSSVPQQPEYTKNKGRSLKPEYLVAIGICTHLGCSPQYVRTTDSHNLGADWKGGFFCPCHGSKFDLAGRVFKGVPAPTNLVIPPYRYVSDTLILIGEDPEGGAA